MSASRQTITLRLFGAGGAFSRRYGTTCSMVTLRDGKRWLIDCGRQAPDQLHAAGYAWHDIHGQIITHCHGDHVFGLEDFAFVRYFETHGDVMASSRGGPLPKYISHSAVRDEVWETLAPSLRYLQDGRGNLRAGTLQHFFDVIEPAAAEPPRKNPWNHSETFEVDGLRVVTRENEHVPGKPSCALELNVGDDVDPKSPRIAWWSGDGTVDAAFLHSIEPRTSIYFHDCTFIDYPGQVHGFFDKLEALPEPVRRKLVIMHHEDNLELYRSRVEAAGFRIALPGHVFDLIGGQQLV
ncbi:MBL fold metallo-hydrolase [Nannocystis sp. SCPEA4]|uniref:MBL fold metallo-hydrolase n=1 Tax=Nannocystis sp. SCPEA4 TaxID=2996787 RepID=UPI00226E573C|nr:MBL fold metallo-hydrolase [Nannocystis sp. SCPEA4]